MRQRGTENLKEYIESNIPPPVFIGTADVH